MLSRKDVIEINKEFHNGLVVNNSSLDFAIKQTARSKNWLKSLALLVRAVLVDHVFEDGNKRTAAALIMTYFDSNGFHFNPDSVAKIVVSILKRNITDIRTIERVLKNAIE